MEDKDPKVTEVEAVSSTVNEIEPVTVVTVKPQKTLEEQIDILKSRKLYIEDDLDAMRILERSNYYRLRGYYIHLQEKDSDEFKPGVSFTCISALHDFDNELRILASGDLPDIMYVPKDYMDILVEEDMILNLDDYQDKLPHLYCSSDCVEGALENIRENAHINS